VLTGAGEGLFDGEVCPYLSPRGRVIAPHTHQNDVWVHVLTGEIGVLVGEQTVSAASGAWALKPRDVVHAMWNAEASPARIIEVLTPGGTERWFEETAQFPDSPWLLELRRRYGLSLA
jgi:uncharacterized cupin superfamily protein